MKKILAMIGAIGLIATSTATVVACGGTGTEAKEFKLDKLIKHNLITVGEDPLNNNLSQEELIEEYTSELKAKNDNLTEDDFKNFSFDFDTLKAVEGNDQAKAQITVKPNEGSEYTGEVVIFLHVDTRTTLKKAAGTINFKEYKVIGNDANAIEQGLLDAFKRENSNLKDVKLKINVGLHFATISVDENDENYRGKVEIGLSDFLINLDLGELTYAEYKDNLKDLISERLNLNAADFTIDEGSETAEGAQLASVKITAVEGTKLIGNGKVTFKLSGTEYWLDYLVQEPNLDLLKSNPKPDNDAIINQIIKKNPRFTGEFEEYLKALKDKISWVNNIAILTLTGQDNFVLINGAVSFLFNL